MNADDVINAFKKLEEAREEFQKEKLAIMVRMFEGKAQYAEVLKMLLEKGLPENIFVNGMDEKTRYDLSFFAKVVETPMFEPGAIFFSWVKTVSGTESVMIDLKVSD